jgi:Ca2+-dependent lipid-binding protein
MSRVLILNVIEARNTIACDRGGSSDPYVVVNLCDIAGREIRNEKFKTEKKPKTLNPRWNTRFTFGACAN